MSFDNDRDERLDRALAALAREVAPPPDLWPAIERQLTPRATLQWPQLLAAGFVLVALTALVTTIVVDGRRAPTPVAAAAGTHRDEAGNAKLVATRGELRRSFDERLPLLAPETRRAVLHSLETIRQAHEELEHALAQDPSSALVRDLLEATWRQEYSLYEDVVRSTDPLAVRT